MNQILLKKCHLIYYFSTCKQADLQYASYMSVCLRNFTCLCSCMPLCCVMCASQWMLYLWECSWLYFFHFKGVWESFWSRGLSHFEQARWGQRSEREATLVPCHHPKTELLQNILKCFRVFFWIQRYKSVRRISCGSWSGEKRTEIKTTERDRERQKNRERLVRKTEHALAQWSTQPCKTKAQQTVSQCPPPASRAGERIQHTHTHTHTNKKHTAEEEENMSRAETAQYSFTCENHSVRASSYMRT